MAQPAVPEDGQGEEPFRPGLPGGAWWSEWLAGFAQGGLWDGCPPGPDLAVVLTRLSGPGWECPGASGDELVGVLGRWAAVEAWAAAGRLGVIREMMRREAPPGPRGAAASSAAASDGDGGGDGRGGLPDAWSESLEHEVAAALAVSVGSADRMAWLAWELGARLPRIGALLAAGRLSLAKARVVAESFRDLDDAGAAAAEALVLGKLEGRTHAQVVRLAARAAATVDPGGVARRRERAEREDARVSLWREQSGATALAGFGLPADEALAANANISARAAAYKASRAFPGATMGQLRAMAYLDLINGVTEADRITRANADAGPDADADADADAGPDAGADFDADSDAGIAPGADSGTRTSATADSDPDPAPDSAPDSDSDPDSDPGTGSVAGPSESMSFGSDGAGPGMCCGECDCMPAGDGEDPGGGNPGGGNPGGGNPGGGNSGGRDPGGRDPGGGREPGGGGHGRGRTAGGGSPPPAGVRPVADLVIPLATLLGLAERPGEAHGLGALDPALCRALAAAAAASPASQWCLTVTGPGGIAIGHGCARPASTDQAAWPSCSGASPAILPARVNLTIPLDILARLATRLATSFTVRPGRDGPAVPRNAPWTLALRVAAPGTRHGPGPCDVPDPPDLPDSPDPPDPPDPSGGNLPGGHGTWVLTLPGGRALAMTIEPVPVHDCDHRHESHGYQPSDKLRHLVQVRDGECTFPPCSRHARESDFEHATPYHRGGRTCACNAGARSRRCHRIKQSPGWNLTQPRPGWHQWITPAGRTYTQGPRQYPD